MGMQEMLQVLGPNSIHRTGSQPLFNGDFKRAGVDLVRTKDDHELALRSLDFNQSVFLVTLF
jgi:hypothetical protein